MADNPAALRQMPKAYDLLASQPVSVGGLSDAGRSKIVVSAIADASGDGHVLSRFDDAIWDLRPYFDQSNVADGQKYILWPPDCPQPLVNDCKAVLYAWFKRGLPGSKPPVALGICQAAIASAIPLMRWLRDLGIQRFDQVRPIHAANYVHLAKTRLIRNASSVYDSLRILDFLWVFRQETSFPLASCPWGESTLWRVSGLGKQGGKNGSIKGMGKTPIIPRDAQSKIFNYCEKVIEGAHALLDERDLGKLPRPHQLKPIVDKTSPPPIRLHRPRNQQSHPGPGIGTRARSEGTHDGRFDCGVAQKQVAQRRNPSCSAHLLVTRTVPIFNPSASAFTVKVPGWPALARTMTSASPL